MFETLECKMDIETDVVVNRFLPLLETLADGEYQELVWVKNCLPEYMDCYDEFYEEFADLSKSFFLRNKEEYLDEENEKIFLELYEMVESFDNEWGTLLSDHPQSLIAHPDWIKIQKKAAILLGSIKRMLSARYPDAVF